ncbi:MAG: hypothetical protein DRN03_04510 [Thermoplasmata archaeon]|nr:MAG: hypothetical protein DRN03_04510 [Thermoplasmata archaeon]
MAERLKEPLEYAMATLLIILMLSFSLYVIGGFKEQASKPVMNIDSLAESILNMALDYEGSPSNWGDGSIDVESFGLSSGLPSTLGLNKVSRISVKEVYGKPNPLYVSYEELNGWIDKSTMGFSMSFKPYLNCSLSYNGSHLTINALSPSGRALTGYPAYLLLLYRNLSIYSVESLTGESIHVGGDLIASCVEVEVGGVTSIAYWVDEQSVEKAYYCAGMLICDRDLSGCTAILTLTPKLAQDSVNKSFTVTVSGVYTGGVWIHDLDVPCPELTSMVVAMCGATIYVAEVYPQQFTYGWPVAPPTYGRCVGTARIGLEHYVVEVKVWWASW